MLRMNRQDAIDAPAASRRVGRQGRGEKRRGTVKIYSEQLTGHDLGGVLQESFILARRAWQPKRHQYP
jgi:hypothetical protein